MLLSVSAFAAGKKAKAPPVSAPAPAPAPAVAAPPPAPVPTPATPPVVTPVVVDPEDPVPLPVLAPRSGLLLGAAGGVVVPFSVLGAGGRGEVRVSWVMAKAPLAFSLSFGFEQHTATTAAFLPPPAGGFERAGIDNQTLYPAQFLAHVLLWRDERNRLQLGAGYALLVTWSETQALGKQREESGVGHEVAGELAYARRFGPVELEVRARYSVRRTAVGVATAAMELPWYQTAGVLLGLGLWP
ncbi:MAG: hypothetical protein Q8L48_30965 [Archangium sp.]|nr:hypothetical protein [Archangium sp.]